MTSKQRELREAVAVTIADMTMSGKTPGQIADAVIPVVLKRITPLIVTELDSLRPKKRKNAKR